MLRWCSHAAPPSRPVPLRSLVSGKSVVDGVEYPASYDFLHAIDGVNDAAAFIQNMAESCPQTKMVLGGYSQGAAVVDILTATGRRSLDSQVRCRRPSLTTSRQWRYSGTRRTVSATRWPRSAPLYGS
jgi:hypothetical protein